MSDRDEQSGNTWGTFVREARKVKGWTIDDLAEAAGVNRMTIIRWENGHTSFRPENVEPVARALGVSTDVAMQAALGVGHAPGRPLHSLAVMLDRLLAEDSPLDERDREALEFMADSLIGRYADAARKRRRPRS